VAPMKPGQFYLYVTDSVPHHRVFGRSKRPARQQGFRCGSLVGRRECGKFETTFTSSIMSTLPLAGITVIEVRSEDAACPMICWILTTFYAG